MFQRPLTRGLAVLAAALAVVGACAYVVVGFLRSSPPTVDFTKQAGPVNLTVQTVGSIGFGSHPTWVSYLVQDQSGAWVHSTLWQLPADRQINVTIYQYDTGSDFRNPVWDGVSGTLTGEAVLNGKPTASVNAGEGNGVAHSFNVPELGVNIPLSGISSTAKNPCSGAPCDPSSDHNTVKFSFHTPPGSGNYRWQCFIPCGLAYLYGNGGPMAAIGYMGGFLKVVPA